MSLRTWESRKRSRRGEAGFSMVQMVITMVVVLIVSTFAIIRVTVARDHMLLAGEARELSSRMEKARIDSIRRHGPLGGGEATIVIDKTSYTLNADFDYDGTLDQRVYNFPSGIEVKSVRMTKEDGTVVESADLPVTVTFDARGRSASAFRITLTNTHQHKSVVGVSNAGEISLDRNSVTLANGNYAEVVGDILPFGSSGGGGGILGGGGGGSGDADPTPSPTAEPTPEPTPDTTCSKNNPKFCPTPTPEPTLDPTPEPTPDTTCSKNNPKFCPTPTPEPTPDPTPQPTPYPTPVPTPDTTCSKNNPKFCPTPTPTPAATPTPTPQPTPTPTPVPTPTPCSMTLSKTSMSLNNNGVQTSDTATVSFSDGATHSISAAQVNGSDVEVSVSGNTVTVKAISGGNHRGAFTVRVTPSGCGSAKDITVTVAK